MLSIAGLSGHYLEQNTQVHDICDVSFVYLTSYYLFTSDRDRSITQQLLASNHAHLFVLLPSGKGDRLQ